MTDMSAMPEFENMSLITIFFDSWNLNCTPRLNASKAVGFILENSVILDQSFKIENIFNLDQISLLEDLTFANLKGIDSTNFISITPLYVPNLLMLNILLSSFEFYLNDSTTKVDQSKCDLEDGVFFKVKFFFKNLIGLSFRKVNYPKLICPIIFDKTLSQIMIFDDITNSLLTRNLLRFANVTSPTKYEISVKNLNVAIFLVYYVRVDKEMLKKDLFQNVFEIQFHFNIQNIEADLFKVVFIIFFIFFIFKKWFGLEKLKILNKANHII